MEKVIRTESTGDDRRHPLPIRRLDTNLITNMGKDLLVTHIDEYQFAKVRMSGEVFEGVELRSKGLSAR
jgi:hypothetical protein